MRIVLLIAVLIFSGCATSKNIGGVKLAWTDKTMTIVNYDTPLAIDEKNIGVMQKIEMQRAIAKEASQKVLEAGRLAQIRDQAWDVIQRLKEMVMQQKEETGKTKQGSLVFCSSQVIKTRRK